MAVENFAVEASHIMMFARAIGDPNPIYSDAGHAESAEPGGIIAPPTFAQASAQFDPDYRLRPKVGKPWMGSGKEATGIAPKEPGASDDAPVGMGARGLHAEQHFEYPPQHAARRRLERDGKEWGELGETLETRRCAQVQRDSHRVPGPAR